MNRNYLSARALLGFDRWDDFCSLWATIAMHELSLSDEAELLAEREQMIADGCDADREADERDEYEPPWSELGWESASLGGAR